MWIYNLAILLDIWTDTNSNKQIISYLETKICKYYWKAKVYWNVKESIDQLVFFIKNNFQHFNFWISIVLESDKQRLSTLILNNLDIPSIKLNRLFFDVFWVTALIVTPTCRIFLEPIFSVNIFIGYIYSTSCIILSLKLCSFRISF